MSESKLLKFPTTIFQSVDNYLSLGFAPKYNLERLLNRISMTEKDFRDPTKNLDGEQFIRVLKFLKTTARDTSPTLQCLSVCSVNNMGLGGIAAMTADTLGDSLQIGLSFYKLIMPIINLHTQETSDALHLCANMDVDFGADNNFIIELTLGAFKTFADEVSGKRLPLKLEFAHSPIWGDSVEEAEKLYSEFFDCEVKFNCASSSLSGNPEHILNTRIKSSNKILHNYAKTILDKKSEAEILQLSISEKARRILKQAANDDQFLDLCELSSMLNMSPRTLSRKLAKDNVQFKDLINEVRFTKAKALLRTSALPIKRLAFKVGYANTDTFVRAFKTHTGKTPHQWKYQQHQLQHHH